eukprot:5980784-Pleurochrysis_carterae.AAC.1
MDAIPLTFSTPRTAIPHVAQDRVPIFIGREKDLPSPVKDTEVLQTLKSREIHQKKDVDLLLIQPSQLLNCAHQLAAGVALHNPRNQLPHQHVGCGYTRDLAAQQMSMDPTNQNLLDMSVHGARDSPRRVATRWCGTVVDKGTSGGVMDEGGPLSSPACRLHVLLIAVPSSTIRAFPQAEFFSGDRKASACVR